MSLSPEQVSQLLKPINNARVLNDGKGHAHVSQQDILAHLIRVFGFGNFDIEVLAVECIFEQGRGSDPNPSRFDVCYRALVRLTIRDAEGRQVCQLENGSTATAQNQTRGDAHDLAYKSAISLSVKRAAIALGDQFGLSLYNKGQREALVRGTIVGGPEEDALTPSRKKSTDIQTGIPQQVALGHDETDVPLVAEESKPAERLKTTPEDDPYYDAPKKPVLPMAAKTRARMFALLSEQGITDEDQQREGIARIIGRPITSRGELSEGEAQEVIKSLKSRPKPDESTARSY